MSAPPHLAAIVSAEAMAWGLGQVAEWLDDVLEAGHTLPPHQERAHQACCTVIEEHARWVAARTDRLLRYSTRFPTTRRLNQTVARALVAVAEAGGFDHLFRVTQNMAGSNMVVADWPPEQRPAVRAGGRRHL